MTTRSPGVPGPLAGQPQLLVRRPPVLRMLLAVLVGGGAVAALLRGLAALFGHVPGPLLFPIPIGVAWLLWKAGWVLRLALRGWSSYALSDESFLFVGEVGDTVGAIPLATIEAVTLAVSGVVSIRFAGRTSDQPSSQPGSLLSVGGAKRVEGLAFRTFTRRSLRQWFVAPGSGATLFDELVRRVRAVNPTVEATRAV